jgi:hypothetical protein
VLADVAQGRGAEQGVGHGVEHHVRVRVAEQAAWVVDPDTSEDQRTSLHQSMRVVSQTYAHDPYPICQRDLHFHFSADTRR